MILRTFVRRLGMVAATMAVLTVAPVAHAAQPSLKATVASNNPLKPSLKLENQSEAACQVVGSALGTVSITEVKQDGKGIEALLADSTFGDSLELPMTQQFKTLEPGQSIEMPLRVQQFKSGFALESVSWSPDGGALHTLYPIDDKKPLDITLSYDAAVVPLKGPALCGLAVASSQDGGSSLQQPLTLGVVAAALLALIIWLIKNRRRLKTLKRLLPLALLAGLPLGLWQAPPARADYVVPPSIQREWDSCMGYFRDHPDITGPVLETLDRLDPVNIIHVTEDRPGINVGTGVPELNYWRIEWNPDTSYRHHDGVHSEGCSALFHEMYHLYETALNGHTDRSLCGSTGIPVSEVNATHAENKLRERLGLPLRTTYGAETIPDDCSTPPPPASCSSGDCADSNGDPHLVTFDGLAYDFQAVGEFVAVRDAAGAYEIQVRQEPWPRSRVVSLNTAIAMKVGADRVELRQNGRKLRVWVNDQEQTYKRSKLPGGGSLIPAHAQQGTVVWPDGSTATVRTLGSFGLHLIVDPAQANAGKVEGLFGNYDGDPQNDLKARGTAQAITADFDQLYPRFADSWRITAEKSLFTYEDGTDTETYTDRSFPDERVDAARLPNRTAAERLCRQAGITDPRVLQNCVLDVALTGRPEFAAAARNSQYIVSGADYGGRVYPISIKKAGDTASITFDAKAGEKIFLDVYGATFPDQCRILLLRDPAGDLLRSSCISQGAGFIDGTTLPVTGKYTITVDPRGKIGEAKLRLIFIVDRTAAITPDGDEQTAVIEQPGVVANLTFQGRAGQLVFVHIPYSTLPDQCGGFDLKGPAGQLITTGCTVGGEGYIDTTKLPVTGKYTIAIDPSERGTGQTRLLLVLPAEHEHMLTLNGSSVTARFAKPGDTAAWRFTGSAGQRVYVDVTNSTINQCGGFALYGPGNKLLDTGCILSGRGDISDDGTVLPASGQYTITLDPSRWITGEATIRVHN